MGGLIEKKLLLDFKLNKQNLSKYLYFISVLFYFLSEFHFKFFWNIKGSYFLVFNILTFIIYFYLNKDYIIKNLSKTKESLILASLYILFIVFQIISNNGIGVIGLSVKIVCGLMLMIIPNNEKCELFQFILKVYVTILMISLFGWIIVNIFKVKIPMYISNYENYYFYDYYIFNMRVEGISFSRYLGMFLEPGHTGILSVLLFVANGGSIKNKENVMLLISICFNLSFAAYILLGIYFLLNIILNKQFRNYSKKIVPIAIVILLIVYQIPYFNGIINYFVISRVIELLTENITGNRFSDVFNVFFSEKILGDIKCFLLGIGSAKYNELAISCSFNSAGFKVYIAQNGVIGLILVILYYLKSFMIKIDSNYIILFVVWFFSFLDISYPIWGTFIIFSILAPCNLKYVKEELINE